MATIEFTTEELASEEWRPVVGWEGRYEVSNLGRVRSLTQRPCIRKPILNKGGYLQLTLYSRDLLNKTASVHILVAEAFLGLRPEPTDKYRLEVNHKDGIKTNCRSSNLEWLTQLQNIHHAMRTGLLRQNPPTGENHWSKLHPNWITRGERNGAAKLTDNAVRLILAQLAAGRAQRQIAKEFGVCVMTISLINSRQIWRHINPHGSPSIGS